MKNSAVVEIQEMMEKFAKQLRSAAYWSNGGYYDTDEERAVNRAKRDVYEEIAGAIDSAFDVDSTLTPGEMKR